MMYLKTEIEKCFLKIDSVLEYGTRRDIIETPENELFIYHYGLGTWVRSTVLRERSKLYQYFIVKGITDKDEMSMSVIRAYREYLKKQFLAAPGNED